ncbi:MAG: ribosomal protein S18-alanine N-acetyltransferase [Selenomonadaceae bacterium]|nr:ribosomal protein S18-alanine N-acetyltransferase [Selenomonadaceae bacterium]
MADPIFREIEAKDIDGVYKVEEASFAIPWTREAIEDAAKRNDTIYLAAVLDEKIVGFIGAWIIAGDAEITNVAVLPELRGQKIASKLMAAFIERAKLKGATAMTLEVRPSNIAAIALYKKFGMEEKGRRKKYYQDNKEDALIFWNTQI